MLIQQPVGKIISITTNGIAIGINSISTGMNSDFPSIYLVKNALFVLARNVMLPGYRVTG